MLKKRYFAWVVIFCVSCIFAVVRLPSLSSQSVIYTYDQGRDFIAGARIILDHNPVFIGPTTGIGGVFHGAWWYYIVALSFLVMGPEPIRYFLFLFLAHLVSFIVFYWAMKKLFDTPTAIWTSLVVAVGSYYSNIHTFAGNNVLAVPSFLSFLVLIGFLLRSHSRSINARLFAFGLGLSLGFTAEFELSFGMFLLPTFGILSIISSPLRSRFRDMLTFLMVSLGTVIPFIPRILFEIKNGFLQTKVIMGFFTQPKLYNPVPYTQVIVDRLELFKGYLLQAFGNTFIIVILCIVLIILLSRVLWKKNAQPTHNDTKFTSTYLWHVSLILCLLFVLSLVYRDTFWVNYYEGIQFGFLILGGGMVFLVSYIHRRVYLYVIATLVIIAGAVAVQRVTTLTSQKHVPMGLAIQQSIVQHIVDVQKNRGEREFCARVFTPPVIPHTYDYLWLWQYLEKEIETPRYDFIHNRCWYIIEPEWKGYEFRQTAWKKQHIPVDASPIAGTKKIISNIEIIEYALP